VCHFVLFILSALRFTDSDYPFGILKLYFKVDRSVGHICQRETNLVIFSYKCPNGLRDDKNG
jgi:hypothetical protein